MEKVGTENSMDIEEKTLVTITDSRGNISYCPYCKIESTGFILDKQTDINIAVTCPGCDAKLYADNNFKVSNYHKSMWIII